MYISLRRLIRSLFLCSYNISAILLYGMECTVVVIAANTQRVIVVAAVATASAAAAAA